MARRYDEDSETFLALGIIFMMLGVSLGVTVGWNLAAVVLATGAVFLAVAAQKDEETKKQNSSHMS